MPIVALILFAIARHTRTLWIDDSRARAIQIALRERDSETPDGIHAMPATKFVRELI